MVIVCYLAWLPPPRFFFRAADRKLAQQQVFATGRGASIALTCWQLHAYSCLFPAEVVREHDPQISIETPVLEFMCSCMPAGRPGNGHVEARSCDAIAAGAAAAEAAAGPIGAWVAESCAKGGSPLGFHAGRTSELSLQPAAGMTHMYLGP